MTQRVDRIIAYFGRPFGGRASHAGLELSSWPLAMITRLRGGVQAHGPAAPGPRSTSAYQLTADSIADLITHHDASGKISFASPASARILGIAPERMMAHGFEAVLADKDRARFRMSLDRCLRAGVEIEEEFRARRASEKSGEYQDVWLEIRGLPTTETSAQSAAGAGCTRGAVLVTRDITRRKLEMQRLINSRDEAERASRAKSAFLATMSHELRTPLNAIIGFSEFLHNELRVKSTEPKHADFCRMIHESGEHLLSLSDLLDISKIEAGRFTLQREPCEIDHVVRAVVDTLRPQAEAKGLTIVTSIDSELPDALVDRRAMRQILINLVANACKFTEQGGVTVYVTCTGSDLVIGVTDTGVGIAQEHLAHLCEPLFQIKDQGARNDGVGLGLSIVRGLVELHNGELGVESKVGEGSCFTVTLPGAVVPSGHRAADPRSPSSAPKTASNGACANGMPGPAGESQKREARAADCTSVARRPMIARQAGQAR